MLTEQKKDRYNDDLNNLKTDANTLRNDARGDLRHIAQETGRQVREVVDTASKEITDLSSSLTSHVRSNPIQSSFIALAVGFFLGGLTRR